MSASALSRALEDSRIEPSFSVSPSTTHPRYMTRHRKQEIENLRLRRQLEKHLKLISSARGVAKALDDVVYTLKMVHSIRSKTLVYPGCAKVMDIPYIMSRCSHAFCGECFSNSFKATVIKQVTGRRRLTLPLTLRVVPAVVTEEYLKGIRPYFARPFHRCPRCATISWEAPVPPPIMASLSRIASSIAASEDRLHGVMIPPRSIP
ncbi:hypothetical protein OF83DRAFT_1080791 [Amylostereum chailletii]|nr:hypothetical protein OF83DRAFT_1080791 [Amylostereum chailletii]